jgi:LysR family transcriptional activator of nhaA
LKWIEGLLSGVGHRRETPTLSRTIRKISISESILRFILSIGIPTMDWLNFHHLRYFWIVAKEGNLARAAARLRVSQPSISGQIRELEAAMGERLFRREGRRNVLTETGRMVLRYADEIFSLGGEMMNALHERPTESALRVRIGLTDSFPKLVGNAILQPLFTLERAVQVICREGKPEDLIAQLAAHRLDLVLADEPPSSSVNIRVFDHRLGETGCLFCAAGKLAAKLERGFPASLGGAPALLPAENAPLRRAAETWLRDRGVKPRVVAEFEDPALMKVMAAESRGFIILPAAISTVALRRYGLRIFGRADDCRISFHALTAERRIEHPAVSAITTGKDWLAVADDTSRG